MTMNLARLVLVPARVLPATKIVLAFHYAIKPKHHTEEVRMAFNATGADDDDDKNRPILHTNLSKTMVVKKTIIIQEKKKKKK